MRSQSLPPLVTARKLHQVAVASKAAGMALDMYVILDCTDSFAKEQRLKGVIFDVDGTLVDSNELHIEAWREAFAHYGIRLTYDAVHAQMGKGGDQLIPVFCTREQVEKFGSELEKLRVEIYVRDYLPQVRAFPRVRDLFERLRADGIKIALATSSKEVELDTNLKNLEVEDLVEYSTSADDAEHSKPEPDIFQAALARLDDVLPQEIIVVGDSPYDAIAASAAGMASIGLLSGGFTKDTLVDAGARAVFLDVADLLEKYDEWIDLVRATSLASEA
jgi:HAD superfamily hydrolase (TIGR01509 family)